jgi:D-3-phosphoglycerate dehydrogenase
MEKLKALVTATLSESGLRELRELMDVEYHDWQAQKRPFTQAELKEMSKGKDIIIVEMCELHRDVIESGDRLKIIGCCRGLRGDDPTIDIAASDKKGIPILFTPGRNLNAVAEFTIFLTLGVLRKARPAINWLYDDQWKEWLDFYTTFRTGEINGRTVGLMGFGNIGKRVAALFHAFGARVTAYDPFVKDPAVYAQYKAEQVDVETLFKESDIVSLHMNVSDDTKAFVDGRLIGMMKPTAFLVKSARAAIVERESLYTALKEKRIAGYATDVYHVEPCRPDTEPLLLLDNVFGTPHLGGTSDEVIQNHTAMLVSDLRKLLNKEQPRFVLNPQVLEEFYKKEL